MKLVIQAYEVAEREVVLAEEDLKKFAVECPQPLSLGQIEQGLSAEIARTASTVWLFYKLSQHPESGAHRGYLAYR